MTLLTVVQTVAQEQGLPTVSDVTSGTPDVQQLVTLVNIECNSLARRFNWSVLQAENEFSTVASTAAYALPTDFLRMISQTAWNRDDYWSIRGPVSAQEWQAIKSGLFQSSIRDRFRIKGSSSTQLYLDPTPSAAETLVFEYISKNWGVDADDASAKASVSKNGDTFLFDEYLIERGLAWRWLSQKGFPYAEQRAEYDSLYDRLTAADGGGGGVISMACPGPYRPVAVLPDGNFGQ